MNHRTLYIAAHKALGLCVSCPSPAAPGRLRCETHLAYHRDLRKRLTAEHGAIGRCTRCDSDADPGQTLCSYHRDLSRANNRAAYRRRVLGVRP